MVGECEEAARVGGMTGAASGCRVVCVGICAFCAEICPACVGT